MHILRHPLGLRRNSCRESLALLLCIIYYTVPGFCISRLVFWGTVTFYWRVTSTTGGLKEPPSIKWYSPPKYCVLCIVYYKSTINWHIEISSIGVVVKSDLGSRSIFSSVTFMSEIRFHVKRSHEVIEISWLLLTCSEMKWLPFQFHDELR